MKYDIEKYLRFMHYPKEWQEWNMLPDKDYLIELILLYEPGNENASEHDRNGVFHWWLRQEPEEDTLLKLTKLTLRNKLTCYYPFIGLQSIDIYLTA